MLLHSLRSLLPWLGWSACFVKYPEVLPCPMERHRICTLTHITPYNNHLTVRKCDNKRSLQTRLRLDWLAIWEKAAANKNLVYTYTASGVGMYSITMSQIPCLANWRLLHASGAVQLSLYGPPQKLPSMLWIRSVWGINKYMSITRFTRYVRARADRVWQGTNYNKPLNIEIILHIW